MDRYEHLANPRSWTNVPVEADEDFDAMRDFPDTVPDAND